MTQGDPKAAGRPLTGRHVLAIVLAFFGVIIAVNLTMAYKAVSTFPGVEERHPYIASQRFDADRRAQEALGWTAVPAYADGVLSLTMTDAAGAPASVAGLAVLVGRATAAQDDVRPVFSREGAVYSAPLNLAPGKWLVRIEAEAENGTAFRQRLHVDVRG